MHSKLWVMVRHPYANTTTAQRLVHFIAAQNKQTHFFHGTNKFPETQRAVHLLQIIFNFLFCPVPVRYSTEIFAKFFHLPPPICIQLWPPPPAPAQCQLSPEDGANRLHLHLKQTVHCFIICEGPCVIQAALWWIWPGSLGWCLLAPAREHLQLSTAPPADPLAG